MALIALRYGGAFAGWQAPPGTGWGRMADGSRLLYRLLVTLSSPVLPALPS